MQPYHWTTAAALLVAAAWGTIAVAEPVEVTSLADTARCRDASRAVLAPQVRPLPPFKAEQDRAAGLVWTKIGDRLCYFDISEVGTNGASPPCPTAALGRPSNTETAAARDPESDGRCTR